MVPTKGTAAVARYRNTHSAQKKDMIECWNFRGNLLVAHVGKALLKTISMRLKTSCEAKRLLSEEQCGFRPHRSTTDMMFTDRRLGELEAKASVPLFLCFTNLQKVL